MTRVVAVSFFNVLFPGSENFAACKREMKWIAYVT